MSKHIIWDSEEEGSDIFYEDENVNLDKDIGSEIIAIGWLGLWDGVKVGYKKCGTNIRNILCVHCGDYVKYFGDCKEIQCDDTHHDGTNHYLFRVAKKGVDIQKFCDKVYETGKCDGAELKKYTKSLYPFVKKIYGWNDKVKK